MIENPSQLGRTRYWIGEFTQSLKELEAIEESGKGDEFTKYQIKAHSNQLEELKEMVAEYEKQHPETAETPSQTSPSN